MVAPLVDEHNPITEARVAEVLDLILRGRWKVGKSVKACAEKWGVGTSRVYQIVAEANKIARSEIGARSARTIERTLNTVARKGREGAMPGDLSAAVQASVALTKIAGWDQPMAPAADAQQTTPTVKIEFVAPERPKAEETSDG